jgi:membrane-bound inhibitor of C-type lysozyme
MTASLGQRCLVAGLALAAPAAVAQYVAPAFSAAYLCDDGAVLQAAYLNPAEGPSLAVIDWAGRLIPMRAGPTGSGARYVAFDERTGFVWHVKGPEGTLLFASDPSAEEEVVLAGCAEIGR